MTTNVNPDGMFVKRLGRCLQIPGTAKHCRRIADFQSALRDQEFEGPAGAGEQSKPIRSRRSDWRRFGYGGSAEMRLQIPTDSRSPRG